MSELLYSPVIFDIANHTYTTPDGVILSGVTSVLSRNMFKDKYSGIPKEILAKAAERGSYVHEQLQNLDEFGDADDIEEVKNYIALKEKYGITPLANEYLISDNTYYATMIDMVDVAINLYDYKTTSKLDDEYLSWQLSINAYLFEMQNPHLKVGKLFAVWLRGPINELREVERKDASLVERLLFCDSNNIPFEYTTPAVQESAEIQQLVNAENLIITIETQLKSAKANREKMLEAIKSSMEKNGQKSIETDRVKITISKPTQRVSLDGTALKAEMPDVYEKYTKISEVKGSIKLTIKKIK